MLIKTSTRVFEWSITFVLKSSKVRQPLPPALLHKLARQDGENITPGKWWLMKVEGGAKSPNLLDRMKQEAGLELAPSGLVICMWMKN
jgi:hypothetical protein